MKKLSIFLLLLVIFLHPSYALSFLRLNTQNGLSQPSVISISQDELGRMWLGTREGLNIYDGQKNKVFLGNFIAPNGNKIQLGSHISMIKSDGKGNMFVLAEGNLFRFNITKNIYSPITRKGNIKIFTLHGKSVWYIQSDILKEYRIDQNKHTEITKVKMKGPKDMILSNDTIFIGGYTTLNIYSTKGELLRSELKDSNIKCLYKSSKGDIWIGTRFMGIYKYSHGFIHKMNLGNLKETDYKLEDIRAITEDKKGNIWFGSMKGVLKYNQTTQELKRINPPHYLGGFRNSSIYSMYTDTSGNIWAGSFFDGACYLNPDGDDYVDYKYQSINPLQPSFAFISDMVFDNEKNLWFCTNDEGVCCVDKEWNIKKRLNSKTNPKIISNAIKTIACDKKRNHLYIGSHNGGLYRYNLKTKSVERFNLPNIKSRTDHNNIIYHLDIWKNSLYLSTPRAIYSFDMQSGKFTLIAHIQDYCFDFEITEEGVMYARNGSNLIAIPLDNPKNAKPIVLGNNKSWLRISSLVQGDGGIYVFTFGNGILHYNFTKGKTTQYNTTNSRIPTDFCYMASPVDGNKIAFTCSKGIVLFNPELRDFTLLDKYSKTNSPFKGSGLLVTDNMAYIGGLDGITRLNLADISLYAVKNFEVYISELFINNELIQPSNKQYILTSDITTTRSVCLKASENNLAVTLALKNWTEYPINTTYAYKLQGLDKEWTKTTNPYINYAHLPGGNYKLMVKEPNLGSEEITLLEIHVNPPLYATWWAFCLYILVVGLIIYLYNTYKIRQKELLFSLKNEKFEKEKIEQLNQEKLQFFTNVSHEFRTPLTLIIGHMDSVLTQNRLPPTLNNVMNKVRKNAQYMNNLISELLDFRKFTENSFVLHLSNHDYVPFLDEVHLMFSDMAIQKGIAFQFYCKEKEIKGWFDTKQLEKVMFNLLSNAFKYTKSEGKICLQVTKTEEKIHITVSDTGVGIKAEETKQLFTRFYQGSNQKGQEQAPGTGIGLALTKLIVEKHHGSISVESELGKGSVFMMELPLNKEVFDQDQHVVFVEETTDNNQPVVVPSPIDLDDDMELSIETGRFSDDNADLSHKRSILLVEDNLEVLNLLKDIFKTHFEVILAQNGKEGLDKTFEYKPDIIISDIMMPEMSGTEMCQRIKNNIDLCHIPIILLTALNSEQQNIDGLNRGADDYICKPFNASILLAKVNNIIRNRLLIQSQITKKPITDIDLTSINPLDQKILKNIDDAIERNLDNTDFGISDLCSEVNMGRSLLFTKFKALIGTTPNKYILDYRLKQAASMLHLYPYIQVTEISDRCGFSSATYFSRCFKNHYGISPQNYRKEVQ